MIDLPHLAAAAAGLSAVHMGVASSLALARARAGRDRPGPSAQSGDAPGPAALRLHAMLVELEERRRAERAAEQRTPGPGAAVMSRGPVPATAFSGRPR